MRFIMPVPFVTVALFSLLADFDEIVKFIVAFGSNESTAAIPSLRCFPKRNM